MPWGKASFSGSPSPPGWMPPAPAFTDWVYSTLPAGALCWWGAVGEEEPTLTRRPEPELLAPERHTLPPAVHPPHCSLAIDQAWHTRDRFLCVNQMEARHRTGSCRVGWPGVSTGEGGGGSKQGGGSLLGAQVRSPLRCWLGCPACVRRLEVEAATGLSAVTLGVGP